MPREVCYTCRRAKIACLCGRIEPQANQVKVVVLQHPDETNNAKGSAIIAELGLKQYQRWVGEDFKQHKGLKELLKQHESEVLVLYPAQQAIELTANRERKFRYLLIIDATWRKAKRIWETNPQLHGLTCMKLASHQGSNYRIRKAPQAEYLSTVESIVVGLNLLEGSDTAYQPLLALFDEMIDFQIENMGPELYKHNYEEK